MSLLSVAFPLLRAHVLREDDEMMRDHEQCLLAVGSSHERSTSHRAIGNVQTILAAVGHLQHFYEPNIEVIYHIPSLQELALGKVLDLAKQGAYKQKPELPPHLRAIKQQLGRKDKVPQFIIRHIAAKHPQWQFKPTNKITKIMESTFEPEEFIREYAAKFGYTDGDISGRKIPGMSKINS